MGVLKNKAIQELEEYMAEFDEITEDMMTDEEIEAAFEQMAAEELERTESVQDDKDSMKEELEDKKKDPYYTKGPTISKNVEKKDPYFMLTL